MEEGNCKKKRQGEKKKEEEEGKGERERNALNIISSMKLWEKATASKEKKEERMDHEGCDQRGNLFC